GREKIIDFDTLTFVLRSGGISSDNALLRDWASSRVEVYFDFGTSEPDDTLGFKVPYLWRLDPKSPNGTAILTPVQKAFFLERCLKGLPPEFFDFSTVVERARAEHAARTSVQQPTAFLKYMARKQKARRRF